MCVRGGAHAGLVREQTACNAVAHCLTNRDACSAAEDSLRVKCCNKDGLERRNDCRVVDAQDNNAASHVEQRHDRNDLLGNSRDTANAAEEDKRCNDRADDADNDHRCAERGVERYADRVCLYHVAGEAQRENNCNREEAGEELAEFTGKACADVVDRTAGNVALVVRGLVLLRENRLAVDGGHAEKRTQPHPENRTRTAGIQCGSRACNVAGADLRRDCGGKRLERTHAVLARLLTVEREMAEQMLPACAELAHLNEARADGKHDAGANQQVQQQAVPYDVADLAYPVCQYFHCHFTYPFFVLRQTKKPNPISIGLRLQRNGKTANRRYTLHREKTFAVVPRNLFLYPNVYKNRFISVLLPERLARKPLCARCTFGSPLEERSPEPHPFTVLIRKTGHLRVLLLRQVFDFFLQTSFVAYVVYGFSVTP